MKTKKTDKNKRITVQMGIVVGIVALAIVGFVIWNSGVIRNFFPAITIDGENYKLSEFNYYYYAYYNAYKEENAQYMDYMFDESKSLKTQEYDENESWFDFFRDGATDSMTSIMRVSQMAEEAGYELSEEDEKNIEDSIAQIEALAQYNGVTTSAYLQGIYGSGMGEELYRKHLTKSYLATGYSDQIKENFTFTNAEIEQHYKENQQKYTLVDYERFYVKASDAETTPTDEEKAAAKATAQEIEGRLLGGEDLKTLGTEYDASGTYYATDAAYYDASFAYGDWLFSGDRKDGDSTVIDAGTGYYVLLYHSSDQGDYDAVDIEDICIGVDTATLDSSADGYNDQKNQLYEDSCTTAEKIQEEWAAGQKTRESFKALAEEYKTDNNTYTAYTKLTKNTLDTQIDAWCFDPSRKEGDCNVLYTEGGFHVIYFVGTDGKAWAKQAEDDLRDEQYNEWYDETVTAVKVKTHDSVIQYAGGN
ncbi:MAG: SurA N-terminal domain-containing protein [Lachnospiraceae bacterium]|nr:SurA N-terminal domain-containing protein [Lachnospiraceae bacterium]